MPSSMGKLKNLFHRKDTPSTALDPTIPINGHADSHNEPSVLALSAIVQPGEEEDREGRPSTVRGDANDHDRPESRKARDRQRASDQLEGRNGRRPSLKAGVSAMLDDFRRLSLSRTRSESRRQSREAHNHNRKLTKAYRDRRSWHSEQPATYEPTQKRRRTFSMDLRSYSGREVPSRSKPTDLPNGRPNSTYGPPPIPSHVLLPQSFRQNDMVDLSTFSGDAYHGQRDSTFLSGTQDSPERTYDPRIAPPRANGTPGKRFSISRKPVGARGSLDGTTLGGETMRDVPVAASRYAPVEANRDITPETNTDTPFETARTTPVDAAEDVPAQVNRETPLEARMSTPVQSVKDDVGRDDAVAPVTNALEQSPPTTLHRKKGSDHLKRRASVEAAVDGILDLSNTTDTSVHETIAPAVTHETIDQHVHHIREEVITRDIHEHDIFHRILPIVDVQVKPARHFVPNPDGTLREISSSDVPGQTGQKQDWVIAETVSKIPSDETWHGKQRGFTARNFLGTQGDDHAYDRADGVRMRESTWVHPPVLEQGGRLTGQTEEMVFA